MIHPGPRARRREAGVFREKLVARRDRRASPGVVGAVFLLLSGACNHNWDTYDPRIDTSGGYGGGPGEADGAGSGEKGGSGGMGAGGSRPGDPCEPGALIECYSADPATLGVGRCRAGVAVCRSDGAAPDVCTGEVTPSSETCNIPADEDCDGLVNEEGEGCACVPESVEVCYDGPPETEKIGICQPGLRVCNELGDGYTECFGQIAPTVEDCGSAADDDCNGLLNDHCPLWSMRLGGASDQAASGVAGDPEGNVVIAGALEGSASFGGDLLTSAGGRDALIVKLDRSGDPIWSRRFGDGEDQSARAVAIDSGGNVVIAGVFRGAIDLGEGLNGKHTSLGQDDIFVAKLAPGGDFMWSRRLGGAGSNVVHSVAVDAAGNTIVAGDFSGVMDVSGAASLTSAGMLDGFAVKLSPLGALLWAKSYGGPGDDACQSVAVSANGDIHLAGYFTESVDFGGGALASGGGTDAFVTKLAPGSGHIWSKSSKLPLDQRARSIAVDDQGNTIALGVFRSAINLGGSPAVGDGSEDLFVTKLGPAGTALWTARFGGAADEEPGGVAVNAAGEVFVVAMLDGAADFGGGLITSAGNDDVVIVKLTPDAGAPVWTRRFGSSADQDGRAILPLATGGALIVGDFAGKIDFGGGDLTSAGGLDVCLAELPP